MNGGAAKEPRRPKPQREATQNDDAIAAYSQSQGSETRTICNLLRTLIDSDLPAATSKIWHSIPVWFINDSPVVGYKSTARAVNLLFWNGQAFGEPALKPVGKFRAAQAVFQKAEEIDHEVIRRWLHKARSDVLDSKALFQRLRDKK
jgi:hypothetical protein